MHFKLVTFLILVFCKKKLECLKITGNRSLLFSFCLYLICTFPTLCKSISSFANFVNLLSNQLTWNETFSRFVEVQIFTRRFRIFLLVLNVSEVCPLFQTPLPFFIFGCYSCGLYSSCTFRRCSQDLFPPLNFRGEYWAEYYLKK